MNTNLTRSNSNKGLVNPFALLRDDMWDLFDRFTKDVDLPLTNVQEFIPKIEVQDRGDAYSVSVEVPGMSEKDINISLQERTLVIEGEKKNETKNEDKGEGTFHSEFSYGRFYRAIPVSEDVDVDQVSESYKDGLLTVDLKKNPEKFQRSRRIEINSTQANKKLEPKH